MEDETHYYLYEYTRYGYTYTTGNRELAYSRTDAQVHEYLLFNN